MPVKLSELHSREAEQALWVSPEGQPGGSGHDEDCVCCPSPKFPSAFILSLHACMLSHFQLFVPLWAVTHEAPLCMDFSRQEYLSRLPFPSPADLPDPRIEPSSPAVPVLAGRFFTTEPPGKPILYPFLIKYKIDN